VILKSCVIIFNDIDWNFPLKNGLFSLSLFVDAGFGD
jgi:hypothetical protein